MERQVRDPLKQLRKKHAAEAKLLAAHQRMRNGVLKEHAKIREAEAAEKTRTRSASKPLQVRSPSAMLPTIKNNCPTPPQGHRLHKRHETPHPKAPLGPYPRTLRSFRSE